VAPGAVVAIVEDLLGPFCAGRSAHDAAAIHDDLYDLMRVRGHSGGYYGDALAGVDIALWDLAARLAGKPLVELLGGRRRERVRAYLSGLPKPTLGERVDFAGAWIAKGFDAVKFASVVADDGEIAEMAALRKALGAKVAIMADLHWRYEADAAIELVRRLDEHDLSFAEAPCAPEDIEGLARVAANVRPPVAAGEEWRNVHEARWRFDRKALRIVQPEMGHTGVTQFMRIGELARGHGAPTIPHATIGVGIFQAASLHAAAALPDVPYHEYQHSVFDRMARHLRGDMRCERGFFSLPTGPGLGVEPDPSVFRQ
jgi:galactonate dehydratase